MTCFSPITAWQLESGEITFSERGNIRRELQLPCSQCIGCRLERSRVWATRVMHEASLYDQNYFVTLTYDDEHLPRPPSLHYRHFQLFIKRLRQTLARKYSVPSSARNASGKQAQRVSPLRFYMCGEYGETTQRPHYHACLFNLPLKDLIVYSQSTKGTLYTSATLTTAWQYGAVLIGALTFDSAAYVSRYCMKKVTGKNAADHYNRVDLDTGEFYDATPEFNRMSLKPGIGRPWLDKYASDVFNHDHVIINGRTTRPGRYYDRVRESLDPFGMEDAKYERYKKSLLCKDNTSERLRTREACARAKLKLKERNLA